MCSRFQFKLIRHSCADIRVILQDDSFVTRARFDNLVDAREFIERKLRFLCSCPFPKPSFKKNTNYEKPY